LLDVFDASHCPCRARIVELFDLALIEREYGEAVAVTTVGRYLKAGA